MTTEQLAALKEVAEKAITSPTYSVNGLEFTRKFTASTCAELVREVQAWRTLVHDKAEKYEALGAASLPNDRTGDRLAAAGRALREIEKAMKANGNSGASSESTVACAGCGSLFVENYPATSRHACSPECKQSVEELEED
jgi:hypothetical protein